jgi:hypothetical protein
VATDGVVAAYVTGRHRALVEEAVARWAIPLPEFAITDVGTRIHESRGGAWRHWTAWDETIARDWAGRRPAELQALLDDLPALQLQEPEKQSTYKLSYFVALESDRSTLLAAVRERLEAAGVRAGVVWSVDESAGVGLLDVLPASAGKREAIRFLQSSLGFADDEVLFAGDSGNDLDVLTSSLPAVLVANAAHEVRSAALAGAEERGTRHRLYLARGGVLGMNGNYAAGILEGVAHFRPELLPQARRGKEEHHGD